MKMEHTECSETSTHKIQTPGNHPDERVQESSYVVENTKTVVNESSPDPILFLTDPISLLTDSCLFLIEPNVVVNE
jgi:hypothetical protein